MLMQIDGTFIFVVISFLIFLFIIKIVNILGGKAMARSMTYRIKEMLNQKGISQKELSEITGITQADISRLESGNSNPTINTIQRIATGLGINIQVNFGKVATL